MSRIAYVREIKGGCDVVYMLNLDHIRYPEYRGPYSIWPRLSWVSRLFQSEVVTPWRTGLEEYINSVKGSNN